MIQKSLSVLWALTDTGIILQNMNTNSFFELNELQERVWAFIDGTHTEEEIVLKLTNEFNNISPSEIIKVVKGTMALLLENGLILHN